MTDRFGRTTARDLQELCRGLNAQDRAYNRLRRQLSARHFFNGAFICGRFRAIEVYCSLPSPHAIQHTILVHCDGSLERKRHV